MARWKIISSVGSRCRADKGTAAIEFGIFAPFFIILIIGVIEIGFAMHGAMKVHNAVEAGLVYAAKNGLEPIGIASAVTNSASDGSIQASPAPEPFFGCPTLSGVQKVSEGTTCSDGSAAGEYIQIDASLDRTSLFPNASFALPATFTAQAIVRRN